MVPPFGRRRCAGVACALVAAIGLAGCVVRETQRPSTALSFAQAGRLSLDVADVQVIPQYETRLTPPYVDHMSPLPPIDAVRRWASERLNPVGASGSVRVLVKDASIKETALPRTQGVKGMFTKDQAWRYDGRLEVELVADKPGASRFSGFTSAVISRSTTVAEDASLNDRERAWINLARQMVEDLDARFDEGIRNNLAPLIRY